MNNRKILTFVHMEKAAGTSFIGALRQSFGVRHCDVLYRDVHDSAGTTRELEFARRLHPELRSLAGHNIRPQGVPLNGPYQLMTFLRDPVKRSLSHYQYQLDVLQKPKPFDQWIEEPRFRNLMTRKLVDCEDVEKAKQVLRDRFFFVGIVERFDESIKLLTLLSPYPLDNRLRRENVRRATDQISSLLNSPENMEKVCDANQCDLELYRYACEELWPLYQERAQGKEPNIVRRGGGNRLLNRLYRNLLYKPAWRICIKS